MSRSTMKPASSCRCLALFLVLTLQGFSAPPGFPQEAALESFILSNRPAPVTGFPTQRTVRFSDYGAIPDDGIDDQGALDRLAADLKAHPVPTEVLFAKGLYHLRPWGGKTPPQIDYHCLLLEGLDHLILRGEGASFIIQNPQAGFIRLFKCQHVVLTGFTVDYDPLPMSHGVIRAVDAGERSVSVEIPPGFPALDAYYMVGSHLPGSHYQGRNMAMVMDPATVRLKPDCGNADNMGGVWWTSARGQAPHFTLTVERREDLRGVAVGDVLAFLTPRRPIGIVRPVQCEVVTLIGITAFITPNTGYSGVGVSEYNVLRCRLLLKKGRFLTSNADALTCFAYGRVGPWIEGCVFENTLDDVMQPEGFKGALEALIDERRFRMGGLRASTPAECLRPGDRLLFFNAKDAATLCVARVAGVDASNQTVTTHEPLPMARLHPVQGGEDGDLTLIYNLDASTASMVIRSNLFSNCIGNALVCHVPKRGVLVEGNRFLNGVAGIHFANHASWTYYPGYPAARYKLLAAGAGPGELDPGMGGPRFTERILLRDNVFIGGYASEKTYREKHGAINFFLYGGAWRLPAYGIGYGDIAILRNRFEGIPAKYAVRIHNAEGVAVEGNLIAMGPGPDFVDSRDPDRAGIQVGYSRRVWVGSNRSIGKVPLLAKGERVVDLAYEGAP